MKVRIRLLALLGVCLTLAVIPAAADTIYSNGPTNGNTDAWTINFGFIVSDTFNVPFQQGITGAEFAMWLLPGDAAGPCAHCAANNDLTAELSITSGENSGTSYFDQTVRFTQSNCTVNVYGYDICLETTNFNGPTLNGGTYWLNLQNASVPSGEPVYWDENSGPSTASENSVGSIPSESFSVLGQMTCSAGGSCEPASSVPEPGSLVLLCSGGITLFGFLGTLRRKLL